MDQLERIGRIAAAFGVAAFFLSLTCMLWHAPNLFLHMDGVLTRTEVTLSKANATLKNLDDGTKVWASSAKDQAGQVDDLALQARGTLSSASDALQSVSGVAQHIQGTADASTALLASARVTTDQLPSTLEHITADFDATQKPITLIGQDAADLDALLKDEAIHQTIVNLDLTTEGLAGVTTDLHKVADKTTADYLRPVPWWKWPVKRFGEMWDVGAAVARHTP